MAWAIDLDGVVWRGPDPIPGADRAVARLRDGGESVVFVTNNSSKRIEEYEQALASQGIPARGDVVSSALIAASLVDPDEVALVCAGPGVAQALEKRGVRTVREGDADVVVVGYHTDFDYGRMRAASTAVFAGARLLATNDDPTYPAPGGLLPGGGAILASIERATGVEAEVAGKPHPPSVAYLGDRLGADGTMVGDRPDTDGGFAVALGWRFGLVLSGATTKADLPVDPVPDVVADDLESLVAAVLAG